MNNFSYIITCERCDNWREDFTAGRKDLGTYRCLCDYWTVADGPDMYTAPDDFCSYAELKCT